MWKKIHVELEFLIIEFHHFLVYVELEFLRLEFHHFLSDHTIRQSTSNNILRTPPPPSPLPPTNAQAIFPWKIVFFYSNSLLNHPKSIGTNKGTGYVCDCQGNDKFNSVTHFIKQVVNATNIGWYNKRKQLRDSSLSGRVDS